MYGRRALAPTLAAVAAAGLLSACSTGFEAGTVEVYTAPDGTDMRQADIDVLGALVVTDGAGGGTLVAGLVGPPDTADTLTGVEFTDAEGTALETTVAGGRVDIPAGELVQTADEPAVTVSGELEPGRLLSVAFTFESSGPVSGQVLVVPREGPYAEVAVPTAEPATGGG